MRHYPSSTSQSSPRSRRMWIVPALLFLTVLVGAFSSAVYGDDGAPVKRQKLWRLEQQFRETHAVDRQAAVGYAQKHGLPLRRQLEDGTVVQMMAVRNNLPVYYKTMNINAADTVGADELWPGGSTSHALNGSGVRLGIWDAASVRSTHQEFGGRVTLRDGSPYSHYHPSHVAGTMIAAGVLPSARGMSYAARLDSYDWDSDSAEMAAAALQGLQISNHSYGLIAGWYNAYYFVDDQLVNWLWLGDISVSTTEDYRFGYYDDDASEWDEIAYNAPEYLIVKSAGNDRGDGPAPGTLHAIFVDGYPVLSTATRDLDGAPDGYDSIPSKSVAKNILTVGAVNDIPDGYTAPGDVVMSSFSGWGPADDGRIKPDISANGVDLLSATDTSDTDYLVLSGTSMASPNAAGTLGLILEQYLAMLTSRPRSATLKALVIHTANEAGSNPGPDYVFGWGLLNAVGAADTIAQVSAGTAIVQETTIADGGSFTLDVEATGLEPMKVTIVWTDPAGTPVAAAADPTDKMLVNDLDLRVTQDTTTYEPWVLDLANPANAATTGDNDTDNVEQIVIDAPVAGTHQIVVNHKGSLSASQDFTIIVTGIQVPTFELSVQSTPEPGASIQGTHAGITDYVVDVPENFPVVLVAPRLVGGVYFTRWMNSTGDTLADGARTLSFVISDDTTVIAEYTTEPPTAAIHGWGLNAWGQVGDGTEQSRLLPTPAAELHEAAQLAGGKYHSLALTPGGEVLAWGSNADGQLGYDAGVDGEWREPRQVQGLANIAHIAAGTCHSLAVDGDGIAWAWGRNLSGQLGDGTRAGSTTPIQVLGLTDVVQVAAGEYHSAALKSDGTVWAWGSNAWGQLGDDRGGLTMDTYMGSITPVLVHLPEGVTITDIVAGANHTLALADDGTMYAWGANSWGQLGNWRSDDAWTPVQVAGLADVTAIAAGSFHSLAIDGEGTVWAWGANWWGQLGDATFISRTRPQEVALLTDAVQVAAGENHSAARTLNGDVYAWGWNRHGQFGNGTTEDSLQPVMATRIEGVAYLASGAWHIIASAPFFEESESSPSPDLGLLGTGDDSDEDMELGDNGEPYVGLLPGDSDDEGDLPVDETPLPAASDGVGDAWVFGDVIDDEAGDESGIVVPPASAQVPVDGDDPVDGDATGSTDDAAEEPVVAEGTEAIVDNTDNSQAKQFKRLSGDWPVSTLASGYYGSDYAYARARSGPENSRGRFSCTTLAGGHYNVYAWWSARADRGENVAYEILHADGITTVRVDQTENGGQWVLLGDYDFAAGTHVVEIHNGLSNPGSFVCADAVRFKLDETVSASIRVVREEYLSPEDVQEDAQARDDGYVTSELTLMTPSEGGLELAPGINYAITWDSTGLPAYAPIEISLYRGGEFVKRLMGTPNTGSWMWPVGYDQRGDAYSVKIDLVGQSDMITDESDNEFVIALPGEW